MGIDKVANDTLSDLLLMTTRINAVSWIQLIVCELNLSPAYTKVASFVSPVLH